MIAALLMAALQTTAAPSAAPYSCRLSTPGGDKVDFTIASLRDNDTDLDLFAADDSAWPSRTLPAARGVSRPEPGDRRWFAMGGGDGLLLELPSSAAAGPQAATLFRRKGRGITVPVAYGYCAPAPAGNTIIYNVIDASADPRAVGQNMAIFDPARWTEPDCALLLSDGTRSRMKFTLKGETVELSGERLWGGHPQKLPIKWLHGQGVQVGTFARPGKLSGIQTMYVDDGTAAKLIRFQDKDVNGYAICGYSSVVRREVME